MIVSECRAFRRECGHHDLGFVVERDLIVDAKCWYCGRRGKLFHQFKNEDLGELLSEVDLLGTHYKFGLLMRTRSVSRLALTGAAIEVRIE